MDSTFVSSTKRVLPSYQTTADNKSLSFSTLKSGTETMGQCIKIMGVSFKEFTFNFEYYGWKRSTFQCPMALFALTNYHELSNEAVVTVTALLLGNESAFQ
jgi:hypothetical protein